MKLCRDMDVADAFDDKDVERVLSFATDNCDAARDLRLVLDLLVQANLHELDEDGSDEEYEHKSEAKTALFMLATDWSKRLEVKRGA